MELNKNISSGNTNSLLEAEFTDKKYFVETYGCQMNDHDSEKLKGMLLKMGFTPTESKTEADVIIFNTCCVREHPEHKVYGNIGALKKLKDEKQGLIIGVCGCMMQQKNSAENLRKRFPFVDIIFGTYKLNEFPSMLRLAMSGQQVFNVDETDGTIVEGLPVERTHSYSANIAIMYGCDNFCTYCIVPYVRGRERSRSHASIIAEAEELAKNGCLEVTLVGQNVNSYYDEEANINFPKLLKLMNDVDGIERIRFITSHPKDLSNELIDSMATLSKVCNHIHLPVQSGSNEILRRMNRGYTREHYIRLVNKLRSSVPDIELTTDIIVGFPGESESDFRDTLELVKMVRFASAYTFMYSKRTGTQAAKMEDQVEISVKRKRLYELNQLQASILQEDNLKYIGRTGGVLVEGCNERGTHMAFGKLTNFKMVYFPGDSTLIGKKATVRIESVNNNSLIGSLQVLQ